MAGSTTAVPAITGREHEVWALVTAHLTNREIADELCLSVRTVESHVSSLIRKLQVSDRRALARRATIARADARPGTGERWPSPITSFVGRETECADLGAAIAAHRMVTATGPGGVGKTRLALRAAQQIAATRRDGGWFVDLVQVGDAEMVLPTVAATIGVAAPMGGSLQNAVAATLGGSDAVLVLDNCEHVLDAVRTCASQLLTTCPSLTVVATSRVRMQAPYEWVYAVPGLAVGGSDDAVSLFVERARAAGAHQPLDRHRVAELCASLEGMALAIELAAARCPTLGLDGLIDGLDRRLGLLATHPGADSRHGSLRDTIAWSYRWLSEDDAILLSTTSVFASWFDAAAAVAVASPGTPRSDIAAQLARLADHSLLGVAPGTPTRYRALESIRQFGAEQLADLGMSEPVHDRHAAWCRVGLTALSGQVPDEAWCGRLDQITADVRSAIGHAVTKGAGAEATRLAELLAERLLLRGRPEECQRSYEQATEHADSAREIARLSRLAAGAAASRLVGNDTLRLLAASAALAEAGDEAAAAEDLAWMTIFTRWAPGIIAELPHPGEDEQWLTRARDLASGSPVSEATVSLAHALGLPDHDPHAAALAGAVVTNARETGRPLLQSVALDVLCGFHLARGGLDEALREVERRGEVLDAVALDAATAYHFNDYLLMASEVHLAAGHLRSAAAYADRLGELACYRDYPHPAIARRLKVDAMAGNLEAAATRGAEFLTAWDRAGRPVSGTLNVTAYAMTMVHGLLGDDVNREQWEHITDELTLDPRRRAMWEAGWAPAFATFDAIVHLERGDPETALGALTADIDDPDVWRSWASGMWRPWYAAVWAEAAVLAGHSTARDRLVRGAPATRQNPIAATIVARAADILRSDLHPVSQHADAFNRLGCPYQARRTLTLAAERLRPPPDRPPPTAPT